METVSGQRAMSRCCEGAKGRRDRRLRAEARIRLQLCRDAVRIASHRGGDGCRRAHIEASTQTAPVDEPPVTEYVTPAPAVPQPVVKYISPAPTVIQSPAPAVSAAPAPVDEYIAPAPVVYAAPAPVVEHISPAPAGLFPVPMVANIAPEPSVSHSPAPVVEHFSPAPVMSSAHRGHEEAVPRVTLLLRMVMDGRRYRVSARRSRPLWSTFDAFCTRLGLQVSQVRFFFGELSGLSISPSDTPDQVGLVDGDLLVAHDDDYDEIDGTESRFPAGFRPMVPLRELPAGVGCMFAHSVSELHPMARGQMP